MEVALMNATLAYAGGEVVLEDVNVRCERGWTAVVGANGGGKSTLLRALEDGATVRSGSRSVEPNGATIVRLAQLSVPFDAALEAFAWEFDPTAMALRSRLALDPEAPTRWDTLSFGERRRWQLAAVLHRRPHVLLLDEPANHLDADARAAVASALELFDGVGVLVSHDRTLLEATCTATIRVVDGTAKSYPGTLGVAQSLWTAEEAQARADAEAAHKQQRRALDALQARTLRLQSAEAQRSAKTRMKNPGDADARGILAQGRADRGAAAAARAAGHASRDLADARAAASAFARRRPETVGLDFPHAESRSAVLAAHEDLRVEPGSRVWLRGPNGAGKSVAARALVASARERGTALYYLAQGAGADAREAVLSLPPDVRGTVLRHAGALGVDVARLLNTSEWSPGARRKVALALACLQPAALLVLDEPTNHLDMPAREVLQAAIEGFSGALVLASHDAALGEAVTTHDVWVAERPLRALRR